jgi:hypothetical protein
VLYSALLSESTGSGPRHHRRADIALLRGPGQLPLRTRSTGWSQVSRCEQGSTSPDRDPGPQYQGRHRIGMGWKPRPHRSVRQSEPSRSSSPVFGPASAPGYRGRVQSTAPLMARQPLHAVPTQWPDHDAVMVGAHGLRAIRRPIRPTSPRVTWWHHQGQEHRTLPRSPLSMAWCDRDTPILPRGRRAKHPDSVATSLGADHVVPPDQLAWAIAPSRSPGSLIGG